MGSLGTDIATVNFSIALSVTLGNFISLENLAIYVFGKVNLLSFIIKLVAYSSL